MKFRGETVAEVDGQSYRLRVDMNVLAAFEDATGQEALAWAERAEQGRARVGEIITFAHCAMLRDHPDVPREIAGDLVSDNPELLLQLFAAASPDLSDKAGAPGKD